MAKIDRQLQINEKIMTSLVDLQSYNKLRYLCHQKLGNHFFAKRPVLRTHRDSCLTIVTRTLGPTSPPCPFVPRFVVIPGDAHALSATASRCLDHDRVADLTRHFDTVVHVFDLALETCRDGAETR